MKSIIGKLFVFLLLMCGILGYLKTGVSLFEKIKNGTINLELRSIDRALFGVKSLTGKFPLHFKKFMSEQFETKTNKKIGTDPWGQMYFYKLMPKGYSIASSGANEKFGDADDIRAFRKGDKFIIETGEVKGVSRTKSLEKLKKVELPLIEDIMVYIAVKDLERPFDKKSKEELSLFIENILASFPLE